MPFTFKYDPIKNYIHCSAEGIVTMDDVGTYLHTIINHPDIKPGFIEKVDYSKVEQIQVSSEVLDNFDHTWLIYRKKGCIGIHIFAPDDNVYAAVRMMKDKLAALYGSAEDLIQIYRDETFYSI